MVPKILDHTSILNLSHFITYIYNQSLQNSLQLVLLKLNKPDIFIPQKEETNPAATDPTQASLPFPIQP